jgi:hypothetical protein
MIFPIALVLFQTAEVRAGTLYSLSVDTSAIVGTSGSLDFQFNPGPLISQSASLEIRNFVTNGTLSGVTAIAGDVGGGPLPAGLLFDNATQFNDYFQGFTFGKVLSFDVLLEGPAVGSPNGMSTSGSEFAFSMFSDSAGTVPALTADAINGFAVTLDVGLDGEVGVTDNSTQTLVGAPVVAPEPGSGVLALMFTVFCAMVGLLRRSAWN